MKEKEGVFPMHGYRQKDNGMYILLILEFHQKIEF